MIQRKERARNSTAILEKLKHEKVIGNYLHGLFIADGCITRCNNRPRFGFSQAGNHEDLINQLITIAPFEFRRYELPPSTLSKDGSANRVRWPYICSNQDLVGFLEECYGRYKENVYITFSSLDAESSFAFLSGYLDGDGVVWKVKGRERAVVEFHCVSEPVVNLICHLLTTLGIRFNIKSRDTSNYQYRVISVCHQDEVIKLKEGLYQGTPYVSYKKENLRIVNNSTNNTELYKSMSKQERTDWVKANSHKTVQELAAQLGVHTVSIKRWLNEDKKSEIHFS